MTKDYDDFINALLESRVCAWRVAEWLTNQGYDIRLLPGTTTPDKQSRFKHVDSGDIEVVQRIEVKYWPEIDFQSIKDIPYENIIVDEAYKVEKFRWETLYGYVILNKSKTGGVLIQRATKKHWFKDTKPDRKEGSQREFYFCPKQYAKFVSMSGG